MAKKLTLKEPDVTYVVTPTGPQVVPVIPVPPKIAPTFKSQRVANQPHVVAKSTELEELLSDPWPPMQHIRQQIQERLGINPNDVKPITIEEIREIFARAQREHPGSSKLASQMVVEMREE